MAKKSKIARQINSRSWSPSTRPGAPSCASRASIRSCPSRSGWRPAALGLLPRDSSECRLRNRCKITGRPRGYIRRIGISRNLVRELAHEGVLPGIRKASW